MCMLFLLVVLDFGKKSIGLCFMCICMSSKTPKKCDNDDNDDVDDYDDDNCDDDDDDDVRLLWDNLAFSLAQSPQGYDT